MTTYGQESLQLGRVFRGHCLLSMKIAHRSLATNLLQQVRGTNTVHKHKSMSEHPRSMQGSTMIRAEFIQRNEGRGLKLEGRLVGAWAVQVKSLLSRHFVSCGFLVDVSEVTYVDPIGEQLLTWLRDLHAKFVAETCYARDVCEKLQLDLQGKETLTGLSRQRIKLLPS